VYRKGYFMSLEQEEASQGKVLVDFTKAKRRQVALQNEAVNLSKYFADLAAVLKTVNPRPITAEELTKHAADAAKVIADLQETFNEVDRLREAATALGLPPA